MHSSVVRISFTSNDGPSTSSGTPRGSENTLRKKLQPELKHAYYSPAKISDLRDGFGLPNQMPPTSAISSRILFWRACLILVLSCLVSYILLLLAYLAILCLIGFFALGYWPEDVFSSNTKRSQYKVLVFQLGLECTLPSFGYLLL